MSQALSGAEFKKQLRAGHPKIGLFLNSHSSTVAEQLAHSGYDWLLVDTQHGPMTYEKLSTMLASIAHGGAKFDFARKLAGALCYVGLVRLDTIEIQSFA